MRIAALVLGILGSLAAGGFSLSVLTDSRVADAKKAIATAKALGVDGQVSAEVADANRAIHGAYALLAAVALGLAGGILAFKGKGKLAGPLMLVGAIIPGILQPLYFIFTALLIIGGALAFFAKPKYGRSAGALAA